MKNNDYEYIKKMFDQDGLKAPESLSEKNIRKMLEQAETVETTGVQDVQGKRDVLTPAMQTTERTTVERLRMGKRWRRSAFALAACAVLAIGLVPVTKAVRNMGPGALVEADAGMYSFKSERQLDRQMHQLLGDEQDHGFTMMHGEGDTLSVMEDAESADSMEGAPAANAKGDGLGAAGGQGGDVHSDTYTQVEGVDEADIVKTDGKYIYYTSAIENQIVIASAKDGTTKRVASINCGKENVFIEELYLAKDQLILIGTASDEQLNNLRGHAYSDATTVIVYDISNPEKPKKRSEYSQTGSLLSSRLIGTNLYLVTNDYVYTYVKGNNTPYICFGGDYQKLPMDQIETFPNPQTPAYTVIGQMDIAAGKATDQNIRTKAILGGADEIYCNQENLYVTGNLTEDYTNGENYVSRTTTQILKVSLADGTIKSEASAVINGTLQNQFSMDETGGYFKVATTSIKNGTEYNALYVLDEQMNTVGQVTGFAKNESIKAVRYVKDKAYVITYEQTDPLFIIDLSDPTAPVIEGHVKISGFSTLLVPADADHMLGFGFSTETTEFGEATNGLKLALFDVSNPSEPVVADSVEFAGMDSQIQYDHKALLADPNGEYFAIPYTVWNEEEQDSDVDVIEEDAEGTSQEVYLEGNVKNGVLVVTVDGEINVVNDYMATEYVNRCISIGEYLYAICDDDSIESFTVR